MVAGRRLVDELLERRLALRNRLLPAAFFDDYFLVECLVSRLDEFLAPFGRPLGLPDCPGLKFARVGGFP